MRKVLLVEDEKLIREGIKASLDWPGLGLEIVGEAADGDKGLEMSLALKPDIILTDVRMPGMEGIEMAKKVLERLGNVQIIVISGYDDFKYVRQSLVLRLLDYLMKPINEQELEDVLKKAKAKIELAENKEREDFEKRNIVKQGNQVLQREILNCLVNGDYDGSSWQRSEEVCRFIERSRLFCVAVVKTLNFKRAREQIFNGDADSLIYTVESIGNEICAKGQDFYFFRKPDKIGEFIIIKGIAETQPEEGYRQLKLICYDFVKALATHTEIVVNIGLGNAKAGVEGIAQSYREGLRVCQKTSFSDKYQVAAYDSYKKGYVENVFSDYEEIFKKSLVGDSGSKALEVVQLIYHKIQNDNQYPKRELYKNISRWLRLTQECVQPRSAALTNFQSEIPSWEEFETLEELWDCFTRRMEAELAKLRKPEDAEDTIQNIKEYIDQNLFTENLSLELLSQKFFMNPFRLCKLFKSKYHENFQSYIIHRKIEKAKELLRDSSVKIYEVSVMVGYEDVKYFSRIFKKYTGLTPNEYREQYHES